MNSSLVSEAGKQTIGQTIPKISETFRGLLKRTMREFHGFAEPYNRRNVFCPGPQAPFMPRPVQNRVQRDSCSNIQGTDAFWRINLVSGDRHQIHADLIHLGRNLSHRLGSIRMKQDVLPSANLTDFRDRLKCSNLVIRVHDAHEDGGVTHGLRHTLSRHNPIFVARDFRNLVSHSLQILDRSGHRRMFEIRNDEMGP